MIDFIKKAAEKTGFIRERYDEGKIPTDPKNITVFPFFGDLRSLFVLSSLLLHRYREEEKGSKYFILCSWSGFQTLFPYVDEYWSLENEDNERKLFEHAHQFSNNSELVAHYYRNLNHYFFEDVVTDVFTNYYHHGLTNDFWQKYKTVRYFLPRVSSSATLSKEFNRELMSRGGFKIFIYPGRFFSCSKLGSVLNLPIKKEFWVFLVKRLLEEKYLPVIYKGFMTYDLSEDFTDQCIYLNEKDFGKVLTAMRTVGFVLDIFTGISRFALAARTPFLMVDERKRFADLKEYEIDDLCCLKLPKQYIFSFPTIINGSNEDTWNFNILKNIFTRLETFLPSLNRDEFPATGEIMELVSYDAVRKRKAKRIGTRLLKVKNGK